MASDLELLIFIPARGPATEEFFLTHSATLALEIREPIFGSHGPCFFTGMRVAEIEEVFEVFPPSQHLMARSAAHHLHSVDSALLPLPQTPDGGPEPFRSGPEVRGHSMASRTPQTPGSLPHRLP